MFIKDWAEIRKSEIPLPEFCAISRDWCESAIPNMIDNNMLLNRAVEKAERGGE